MKHWVHFFFFKYFSFLIKFTHLFRIDKGHLGNQGMSYLRQCCWMCTVVGAYKRSNLKSYVENTFNHNDYCFTGKSCNCLSFEYMNVHLTIIPYTKVLTLSIIPNHNRNPDANPNPNPNSKPVWCDGYINFIREVADSRTWGIFIWDTTYFIAIQWSIRSSFIESQWNMPYPIWKCLTYGSPQLPYYVLGNCIYNI